MTFFVTQNFPELAFTLLSERRINRI
jgi:hypothetical protein